MASASRFEEIDVRPTGVALMPWLVLALILAVQTAAQFGSQAILPIGSLVQDDLVLTRAQVGLFASAVWGGCIITLIAAGWLVDRFGGRLLFCVGPVVIGVFLALAGRSESYQQLLAALVLVGCGLGMTAPAATKAVMYWFATSRARGTAMGIKQTGTSLGGAIGAAVLPAVAIATDWRNAVLLAGLAVVGIGVVGAVVYREPHSIARKSATAVSGGGLAAVLRNRSVQLCCVAGLFLTGTQLTLSAHLVLYLKESVAMTVVAGGAMLALAQMSGLAGRVILGVASDRFLGGRRKGMFLICSWLAFLAAAAAAAVGSLLGHWSIGIIVAALGFGAIGWTGIYVILISESVGKELSGTATGVGLTASSLGGVIVPPIFGMVVDLSHSYPLAWALIALIAAIASLAVHLVRERPLEAVAVVTPSPDQKA